MKKRILAMLLAICLIAGMLPTTVFADDAYNSISEDSSGEGYLTFTLNADGESYSVTGCDESASGVLVIPAYYNGKPVTSIGEDAFSDCTSLTSITIPDSVTSIGERAFSDCTSLTSITIPDSVTSIGSYAFFYCYSLTSITIPDSVTSIGSYAFCACSSLTSITIPDSVTSIGDAAFYGCSNLTSITIPDSVTSIGERAFLECTSLTSITIPDSVTSIGERAFEDCSSLTSITIPDSVTSIDICAFYRCSSLTSITIPDGVTSIGDDTFYECTNLTSITLPNSITRIGSYAFYGCTNLTSITIPDSVTSIDVCAFCLCSNLTKVYYCGTREQWNQISIHYTTSFTQETLQLHNYQDDVCTICGHLKEYTVVFKDWDGTVLSTNSYHWGDEIAVPANPTGPVDNIYTYTFAGWDKNVATICESDATYTATYTATFTEYTITFKNWDGTVLSTETYHYGDTVTVPATPSKAPEGNHTYTFAGWDTPVVRCAGDATYTATYTSSDIYRYTIVGGKVMITGYIGNETNLVIPGTIENLPVTGIGGGVFMGRSDLISVVLPDSITSIGSNAFAYCIGLTSITIPGSVSSIGSFAFADCIGLTNVTIENGVTRISSNAFTGCISLTDIAIPGSITSIGDEAFAGCNTLTGVTYCGTQEQWNAVDISGYNAPLTEAALQLHNYQNGVCTICGNSTVHTHSYEAVVTAPTCTTSGYTTYTCGCGVSYVSDEVAALGHSWKPATTSTPKTCTVCGATKGGVVLPNAVAEVNDFTYATLTEAIANANGAEITLLKNSSGDALVITADTLINFNSYYYTVNTPVEETTAAVKIISTGTLTLNGKGTLSSRASNNTLFDTLILNEGSLAIDGITLKGDYLAHPDADGYYTIRNTENAVANINSGETTARPVNGVGTITKGEDATVLIPEGYSWSPAGKLMAPEHIHNYITTLVGATSEANGYIKHTCTCGVSYEDGHFGYSRCVATVEGIGYLTLQDAIDNANGAEVKLLKNSSGDALIITKDTSINFDGYYYTVNTPVEETTVAVKIAGKVTLTLNGTGKLATRATNKAQFDTLILNEGTLNVNGVTLRGDYLAHPEAEAYYTIRNAESAVANINSGEITGRPVNSVGKFTKGETATVLIPNGYAWDADGKLYKL